MAKLSPFRKIKCWVIYDPAKKQIGAPKKYKHQLPTPRRGSGKVIVEMTGFYPASARDAVCEHRWTTAGLHSNEYCAKCFVDRPKSDSGEGKHADVP